MSAQDVNPGERILVWGNSCSGKSTLAQELAEHLDLEFVELDALNWLPDWVGLNATDPDLLEERIRDATAGDRWAVAGSYSEQAQATFWPRLQTIIWLDLPMWLLLIRVIRRSWIRWRTGEHLWGTNYESFWQQLKIWEKEDSLVWWIVTQHQKKRRDSHTYMTDPRWSHIRWVRLRSPKEVANLKRSLGISVAE